MIPGKILRFLEAHGNLAFAGVRDRHLHPTGYRVSAWQVASDGRTLTAHIPGPFLDRLVEALLDNGQIAITVEEAPSHETYQLKGTYLQHRAATADDRALAQVHRERLARAVRTFVPPEINLDQLLAAMHPDPDVAVEVDIREVYVQTPGPGAGARLYPPPEV